MIFKGRMLLARGVGYGEETCAEPLKNGKIQGEEGFGKGTNN